MFGGTRLEQTQVIPRVLSAGAWSCERIPDVRQCTCSIWFEVQDDKDQQRALEAAKKEMEVSFLHSQPCLSTCMASCCC